ncbi:uncharacterized protein PAC_07748 [Phialocephala subalpina]|uniref:Heterokaryon incompatibility domain-containing protein n=1 Tax=Phialocephala subalpina TaxID=576137 RepID=A0A1L7WYK5_9HELO|nr:uncharacterized protein PAC_07748 [Phialocephala subalpina]
MPSYKYNPIDSASSEIRLLTIHRDIKLVLGRTNAGPLSGTLTNHHLPAVTLSRTSRLLRSARLPIFYALSYVWGQPAKSHEILIDGQPIAITENLYSGLRAIQKSSPNDILVWADALCINQDDFEERSAQILLMREIYHSAYAVRIWLGPSSPDATRCLEFVDKITGSSAQMGDAQNTEDDAVEEAFESVWQGAAEALGNSMFRIGQSFAEVGDIISPAAKDEVAELLLSPDENYSLHQDSIEDISNWRPSDRRLRKVKHEGDFDEISNLMARIFIQHDWFTRMWVVQEVGAADTVEMQVGSVAMGWRYIVRTIYYLHFVRNIPIENIERKRQSLRDLVRECRYRKATDPRDKVYSLLGLMGDRMNEYLKPDYTKSVGEAYSNTTRHFITQARSIDPICGWQKSTKTNLDWCLPSWVPDYSLDQNLASSPLTPTDGRESLFAASGFDRRSEYLLSTDMKTSEWRSLKTIGILIDSIAIISPGPSMSPRLDDAVNEWHTTLLSAGEILDGLTEEVQRALGNISIILSGYNQPSQDPSSSPKMIGYDPTVRHVYLDAYVNTIISGRISSRERASKKDIAEIMRGSPCDPSTCTPQEFSAKVLSAIQAGMLGRRLAITKSGHIGAVPETARIGDLICVLYGCSVPVVLRSSTEGESYKFAGECYLYGFMDAEAIALHMKGSLQENAFTLT